MPISIDAKRRAQAIINVFETGKAEGDYSATTILGDGAGISYGKSQSTDGSDTLDSIVLKYLDLGGKFSAELKKYLDLLTSDATTKADPKNIPPRVAELMGWLRKAGSEDPLMRTAQDCVFDSFYWMPAQSSCEEMELVHPLSYTAVYDTCIQSGPAGVAKIRALFPEIPPVRGGDEKKWTQAYIRARKAWLASFTGKTTSHTAAVRATTYRMDALQAILDAGNWSLLPPISIPKPRVTITF